MCWMFLDFLRYCCQFDEICFHLLFVDVRWFYHTFVLANSFHSPPALPANPGLLGLKNSSWVTLNLNTELWFTFKMVIVVVNFKVVQHRALQSPPIAVQRWHHICADSIQRCSKATRKHMHLQCVQRTTMTSIPNWPWLYHVMRINDLILWCKYIAYTLPIHCHFLLIIQTEQLHQETVQPSVTSSGCGEKTTAISWNTASLSIAPRNKMYKTNVWKCRVKPCEPR